MGIRILKAGMMTTVQDLGRTGYQSQGFSVAGVMDVRSFKIANLLLDNPENEAVLEFALIGPTLEFTAGTLIAITGDRYPQRGCIEIRQRADRQQRIYCIFQLSEDFGGDGQPMYEYEEFDRGI